MFRSLCLAAPVVVQMMVLSSFGIYNRNHLRPPHTSGRSTPNSCYYMPLRCRGCKPGFRVIGRVDVTGSLWLQTQARDGQLGFAWREGFPTSLKLLRSMSFRMYASNKYNPEQIVICIKRAYPVLYASDLPSLTRFYEGEPESHPFPSTYHFSVDDEGPES